MKIEPGKYYRDGHGQRWQYVGKTSREGSWNIVMRNTNGDRLDYFNEDGCCGTTSFKDDLIAEWTEPDQGPDEIKLYAGVNSRGFVTDLKTKRNLTGYKKSGEHGSYDWYELTGKRIDIESI